MGEPAAPAAPGDWTNFLVGQLGSLAISLWLAYTASPSQRLVRLTTYIRHNNQGGHLSPWREVVVPYEHAVAAAEELACDLENYAGQLQLPIRDEEDMDLDALIAHLDQRINNAFH